MTQGSVVEVYALDFVGAKIFLLDVRIIDLLSIIFIAES
jgi:hypothetical protein